MLNCFGCPLPQRTAAEGRGSLVRTVNARHVRRPLGTGLQASASMRGAVVTYAFLL
jgi:hypothetical protein